jgi:hypothetical protein
MLLPGNAQIFLIAATNDACATRGAFFAIGQACVIGLPAFLTHLITSIDIVTGFSFFLRTAITPNDAARADGHEDCGRNKVVELRFHRSFIKPVNARTRAYKFWHPLKL